MMLAWFSSSEMMASSLRCDGRDRAGVRRESALEDDGRLHVLKLGQPLLELLVDRHRPDDRPHRPRARAPLLDGLDRRLLQLRVVRQAEIVVGLERLTTSLAVDGDPPALRRLHLDERPVEMLLLERVDLLAEPVLKRVIHDGEKQLFTTQSPSSDWMLGVTCKPTYVRHGYNEQKGKKVAKGKKVLDSGMRAAYSGQV